MSFTIRNGQTLVLDRGASGLPDVCTVESEGQLALFGLKEELACVKGELCTLKKAVEDTLGRVDSNLSLGLGQGSINGSYAWLKRNLRFDKGKGKLGLGRSGPPLPKMRGI